MREDTLPPNPVRESPASPATYPLVRDVGLSGLLVTFGESLDDAANTAALAFRAALEAERIPGVVETSTSLVSAFVVCDAHADTLRAVRERIDALLGSRYWPAAILPTRRAVWRIPAAFGGDDGPELDEAAAMAGLSPEAAVAEIAATRVRVMTLGFAPGQPYLGTLGPHWNLPRLTALTPCVPAGALVVAIRQLVLFTNAMPTGWRRIGRAAFRNFRPEDASPFPLRAGDEIELVPVDAAEIERLVREDPTGGARRRDAS